MDGPECAAVSAVRRRPKCAGGRRFSPSIPSARPPSQFLDRMLLLPAPRSVLALRLPAPGSLCGSLLPAPCSLSGDLRHAASARLFGCGSSATHCADLLVVRSPGDAVWNMAWKVWFLRHATAATALR